MFLVGTEESLYRTSQKFPEGVPWINLMMTTSGDTYHFSFMKSALSFALSALLYDQTKHIGRKHFCLHAVLVKLHNTRNTAKARLGLHGSKQQANANRNAQRG